MLSNYEDLLVDARFALLGVTLVWVVNNQAHFLVERQGNKMMNVT